MDPFFCEFMGYLTVPEPCPLELWNPENFQGNFASSLFTRSRVCLCVYVCALFGMFDCVFWLFVCI